VCVKFVRVTSVSHVTRNSQTVRMKAKVDEDIRKASNTSVYDLMTKPTAKQRHLTNVCS